MDHGGGAHVLWQVKFCRHINVPGRKLVRLGVGVWKPRPHPTRAVDKKPRDFVHPRRQLCLPHMRRAHITHKRRVPSLRAWRSDGAGELDKAFVVAAVRAPDANDALAIGAAVCHALFGRGGDKPRAWEVTAIACVSVGVGRALALALVRDRCPRRLQKGCAADRCVFTGVTGHGKERVGRGQLDRGPEVVDAATEQHRARRVASHGSTARIDTALHMAKRLANGPVVATVAAVTAATGGHVKHWGPRRRGGIRLVARGTTAVGHGDVAHQPGDAVTVQRIVQRASLSRRQIRLERMRVVPRRLTPRTLKPLWRRRRRQRWCRRGRGGLNGGGGCCCGNDASRYGNRHKDAPHGLL
eukprot:m.481139 g.481139  ORF g.481139 m.481139 type:complete len:356 (-) comp22057_c0_seq1:164-1231(-)